MRSTQIPIPVDTRGGAYRGGRRGFPVGQHERRPTDATQRRQRRAHRDPVPRRPIGIGQRIGGD